MAEMVRWPEAARLATSFLLTLCVVVQTLALVLSYYRHPRNRARVLENLLEGCVLFQIFACTLLHGQLLYGYELGRIAPTGHVCLRYIIFAVATLLAVTVMASIRKAWPLSVVLAAGLT
ncbi:hypothetical protein LJC60_09440, partial [Ruminococcaceae bacterium OttesenSCG-928-D13]|nr:hypothetical protein [Ruminococcaceae bacterium OttesenSCG-928-D13]